MKASLGRVMIFTRDIEALAAFYATHFDFVIIRRPNDSIIELQPTEAGSTLLLHGRSGATEKTQTSIKLVFDVEDVPGFCETARENGLVFGKPFKGEGYLFANAKDPAGNAIQVSSRAFAP